MSHAPDLAAGIQKAASMSQQATSQHPANSAPALGNPCGAGVAPVDTSITISDANGTLTLSCAATPTRMKSLQLAAWTAGAMCMYVRLVIQPNSQGHWQLAGP